MVQTIAPGTVDRLIEQALAIEAQDAREAGALGYMARALVQASRPHKRVEGITFERRNGAFSLVMVGHPPTPGCRMGAYLGCC